MKVKLVFFYILMVLFIATDVFIFIEAGTDASGSSNQSMGITQMLVDFVRLFDPNSEFVTNPDFAHHVVRKLVGRFGLFGVSGILTTADLMLIDEGLSNKKIHLFQEIFRCFDTLGYLQLNQKNMKLLFLYIPAKL